MGFSEVLLSAAGVVVAAAVTAIGVAAFKGIETLRIVVGPFRNACYVLAAAVGLFGYGRDVGMLAMIHAAEGEQVARLIAASESAFEFEYVLYGLIAFAIYLALARAVGEYVEAERNRRRSRDERQP